MNYTLIDSKLKSLIRVCKKTGNDKKLAVVSFILTSNLLDEIGIKLGIRPRDKDSDETIFRYMTLINSIFKKNLKIVLFREDIMTTINEIEIQFIKRRADIPSDYIKEMYDIYYDIRKLDIPNLHETFKNELIGLHSEAQLYELMSPGSHRSAKKQPDKIKALILHKIHEKEVFIQNQLSKSYDKGLFESAMYLKKVKSSIRDRDKGKIQLTGQLKDNINYQCSLEDILGYCLLGFFGLFFMLGLIITIETIFHPSLTGPMSILFLITYGASAFFFILYWNYFKKEEGL